MENTKKKKVEFVGFWHYGVILTYMSVAAAIVGIYFSVGGNKEPLPWVGILCLFISGLCDSFDGTVARTRKNRSREDLMFGERIDSLSDLVAFGVAPTAIAFGLGINRWFQVPVFVIFALCALVRLAYFDVTEEIRMEDPNCGKRKYYEGLPVTNAGFLIPMFYLIAIMFDSTIVSEGIMMGGYLLVAFLFVLKFKLPKISPKQIMIMLGIILLILGILLGINLWVLN